MEPRKLNILTKPVFLTSLLLIFFIYGCLPYRSAWESSLSQFVGNEIYLDKIFEEKSYIEYGRYFYNKNVYKGSGKWGKRGFDKIVNEDIGVRYYITYGNVCKYSILIDENNVMLSWRYETKNRSRCIVY